MLRCMVIVGYGPALVNYYSGAFSFDAILADPEEVVCVLFLSEYGAALFPFPTYRTT